MWAMGWSQEEEEAPHADDAEDENFSKTPWIILEEHLENFVEEEANPDLMKHGILFLDANFARINFAKVP